MTSIWPNDSFDTEVIADEPLRPFRCVLLMPIHSHRFDHLAKSLANLVNEIIVGLLPELHGPGGLAGPAAIQRLDWVQSAGAIQHQIWEKIAAADLVICDLTGQNPNVLFEAGVAAARKRIEQVIFLRDAFYRVDQPFDIAPFRYATYTMTSDGVSTFTEQMVQMIRDVVIGFPDRRASAPILGLPLAFDFSSNHDDPRLVAPAYAHRRVRDGWLEFGSLRSFPHSWLTVGQVRVSRFQLSFVARFALVHPEKTHGYIGVGLRSQHYYAGYGHIIYLNRDGSILMAQPDESPAGFHDETLRGPQVINPEAEHSFAFTFTESMLTMRIDDFAAEFSVASMPKALGSGLIRLQAHMAWMGIRHIEVHAV